MTMFCILISNINFNKFYNNLLIYINIPGNKVGIASLLNFLKICIYFQNALHIQFGYEFYSLIHSINLYFHLRITIVDICFCLYMV